MYQIVTVPPHVLPEGLRHLKVVIRVDSTDMRPIIETSLDSEFGTNIISALLEEERFLLTYFNELYFERRDLKMKDSINSPYYERRKQLSLELFHTQRKSRFTKSFKNNLFWRRQGLTRAETKRLYKIVKTIYVTTNWNYYLENYR